MQDHVYTVYRGDALDFGSGTVTLGLGLDPATDLATLTVRDNDSRFDGDHLADEWGSDASQFGALTDLAGNPLMGGPGSRVYLEEAYVLTGPDGSRITVYRVEIAGPGPHKPGQFAGYIADGVLRPGVTYTAETVDVTAANAPLYSQLVSAPICFTPGTLIETPDGPRPVEALRRGDLVTTRDHGPLPLRWTGARCFTAADLAANPALRPVLIRAHAFGPGRPARDMRVSPRHRILMAGARADLIFGAPEWLAPAIGLVNGGSILRDRAPLGVTYVHVLCDGHQILTADGIATESFHPGAWGLSTLDATTRAELLAIFPELADLPDAWPAARPALTAREARLLAPAP